MLKREDSTNICFNIINDYIDIKIDQTLNKAKTTYQTKVLKVHFNDSISKSNIRDDELQKEFKNLKKNCYIEPSGNCIILKNRNFPNFKYILNKKIDNFSNDDFKGLSELIYQLVDGVNLVCSILYMAFGKNPEIFSKKVASEVSKILIEKIKGDPKLSSGTSLSQASISSLAYLSTSAGTHKSNSTRDSSKYSYEDQLKSSILKDEEFGDLKKKLSGLLKHYIADNNKEIEFNCIYDSNKDKDTIDEFNKKCGNINSPTLTVITTTKDQIFGGYTNQGLMQPKYGPTYKKDQKAFLYNLNKEKVFQNGCAKHAILCSNKNVLNFGDGPDLLIKDQFLSSDKNFTENGAYNFYNSYELNGGEKYFKVKQLQVFSCHF